MKPRIVLASCPLSGGRILELQEHDGRPLLHVHGEQVVGAQTSAGEVELARVATAPFRPARQPRILLIGLGLGRLLAGLLDALPQRRAKFLVAEPIEALPRWHRDGIAGLDPATLGDPRVECLPATPEAALRGLEEALHAIVLHLDAGAVLAEGLKTVPTENPGWLTAARDVLRPGGLLAVAALRTQSGLTQRLRKAGFDVSESSIHVSPETGRARPQPLWLARKRGADQ